MNDKIEKRVVIETCVYTKRVRKTDVDMPDFLAVFPNISIAVNAIEGHPSEADIEYYVPVSDLAEYKKLLETYRTALARIENTALAGAASSYHKLNNFNRFDG